MGFLAVIFLVFALVGAASYFISQKVYNKLLKDGNTSANLLRWVTLVVSFILITGVVFLLFIYNIRLER